VQCEPLPLKLCSGNTFTNLLEVELKRCSVAVVYVWQAMERSSSCRSRSRSRSTAAIRPRGSRASRSRAAAGRSECDPGSSRSRRRRRSRRGCGGRKSRRKRRSKKAKRRRCWMSVWDVRHRVLRRVSTWPQSMCRRRCSWRPTYPQSSAVDSSLVQRVANKSRSRKMK